MGIAVRMPIAPIYMPKLIYPANSHGQNPQGKPYGGRI